jgi:hypothetical protein
MSELGEKIAEIIEETGESRLGTIVALLVALAATFVALAGVKDRNLTLGMTRAQTKAVDAWNQVLNVRHDQFDLAEAGISVAIALLGVTALTGKRWLLGFAGVFLGVGVLFGLAGFLNWNIHADALVSRLA